MGGGGGRWGIQKVKSCTVKKMMIKPLRGYIVRRGTESEVEGYQRLAFIYRTKVSRGTDWVDDRIYC